MYILILMTLNNHCEKLNKLKIINIKKEGMKKMNNMNNLRQPSNIILKDGRTLQEVIDLHEKWLSDEEGGEKANLSGEDLSHVNLSYVDLSCTNLIGTNLEYADLNGANLNGANFYLTNLYKCKGDFVSVGNIGSRNDTTHYFYKDNRVICGCFDGSMKQFEEKVKEAYKEDEVEYKEYMIAIRTLKELAELHMNN